MLEHAKTDCVIRRLDGALSSDVKFLGYANIVLEYRGKKY